MGTQRRERSGTIDQEQPPMTTTMVAATVARPGTQSSGSPSGTARSTSGAAPGGCFRGLEDEKVIYVNRVLRWAPGRARLGRDGRVRAVALVMPSVLRRRPAPHRPRRPRAAPASHSRGTGCPRRGCRLRRRSRSAGARCGDAGRRPHGARRTGVGMPGRADRGCRCSAHPELLVVDRQDADVRRPRAPTPGLGVARVDEQAPDPGFEAIRVTQGRELAPDGDERALQGVLGEIVVAQDPRGKRRTSGRWSCGPAPRTHRDRRSEPGRQDPAPSLPLSAVPFGAVTSYEQSRLPKRSRRASD